jgi:hypothetical protein
MTILKTLTAAAALLLVASAAHAELTETMKDCLAVAVAAQVSGSEAMQSPPALLSRCHVSDQRAGVAYVLELLK